jgi:hypothetical protein
MYVSLNLHCLSFSDCLISRHVILILVTSSYFLLSNLASFAPSCAIHVCQTRPLSKIAHANRFVMIIPSNCSACPVMHPKQNPTTLKSEALRSLKMPVKGKEIPLQAWTGPQVSRRLRLPDFKTFGT